MSFLIKRKGGGSRSSSKKNVAAPEPPTPESTGIGLTLPGANGVNSRYNPHPSATSTTMHDDSASANCAGGIVEVSNGHSSIITPASEALAFQEYYKVMEKISNGSFGVVHRAIHIETQSEFAVKIIERTQLEELDRVSVEREIGILRDCRNMANVVKLIDFYVAPQYYFVVQMLARGGDVFERLAQRTNYTEKHARDLARRLLEAVDALHSRGLAHRDLKPENLLLLDVIDDSRIVVADFGFASYVTEEGLKTRCGTPAFVAPEIMAAPKHHYDERVDNWSVGCLLYMLLCGYPPFQDKSHKGIFKKIRGGDFVMHDKYWSQISIHAKNLISNFLVVNPADRLQARQALRESPWLNMDENILQAHDLTASLGEIRKFHEKRSLIMENVAKFKNKSATDLYDKDDESDTDLNLVHQGDDDAPIREASDSCLMKSRSALNFDDVYKKGDLLHQSQTWSLYECFHRQTGAVAAVKEIARKETTRKSITGKTPAETVLHEVAILDALDHENIIKINEFFEDEGKFYLVSDRMRGSDIFERIIELKRYTEENTKLVAQKLLSAVAHCHAKGIVHRDLKPQTLLLQKEGDLVNIKLSDFGFACRIHTPNSLTTRCGTPAYVAPEVLKNIPYDHAVDCWSIGVILYIMLVGYPPIADENQSELFRKIRIGDWKFQKDEPLWDEISRDAKVVIKGLLVVNPHRRLTAVEALQSPWFVGLVDAMTDVEISNDMSTNHDHSSSSQPSNSASTHHMGEEVSAHRQNGMTSQSQRSKKTSRLKQKLGALVSRSAKKLDKR